MQKIITLGETKAIAELQILFTKRISLWCLIVLH